MLLGNKMALIGLRHIAYTYMKQGALTIAVSMYSSFTVFSYRSLYFSCSSCCHPADPRKAPLVGVPVNSVEVFGLLQVMRETSRSSLVKFLSF